MQIFIKHRKLIVATLFGLLIVGLIIQVVGSRGYLDITINNSQGPTSIEATNQQTGEKIQATFSGGHFRKAVRAGNYEIFVKQDARNAVTQALVSGYLSQQRVDLSLVSETGRAFVGDNPAPCQYYVEAVLLSYECSSSGGITEHVAATTSTPTYTQVTTTASKYDDVIGITKTKQGSVIITKTTDLDSGSATQSASLLTSSFSRINQTLLKGIDGSESYTLASYKDGFVLYTYDLGTILYFSSIDAVAQPIDILPKDNSLSGRSLVANQDSLVAVYSSSDASDNQAAKLQKSEIVTLTDKATSHYPVTGLVSKAVFCGKYVCALSGDVMTAYLADCQSMNPVYSISHVNGLQSSSAAAYIVTSTGVLKSSDGSLPAHYIYTFGAYKFCGLNLASGSTIVCLINSRNDKVALLLA
ncbi:MAG: hypothetical protein ABIV43_03520, partial [Candidatus Saccharimonadales bacterium]